MSLNGELAAVAVALPGSMSWDPGRRGLLVDSLLTEQSDLRAVERFAQFHEHTVEPLQGRYYTALLPVSPPRPGEQLAFEVDLERCSGCKACVAACHTMNGLDDGEAWRDVGLLVGGTAALPVLQHVTSACHHCLDPACLSACPVDAFEKDPHTGIVRHLDDQCFGCQYCTMACPYDVPKFHAEKGIVRKCDMCSDRLSHGEAPACVQACPHEAIRITVVDCDLVRGRAQTGDFLSAAFDPSYTIPTTLYHENQTVDLRAADENTLRPEHAHPALVAMLVLTQLGVGGFVVELGTRLAGLGSRSLLHLWLCLGLGYLGLTASLFHLGRPHLAYRAILGWRHSWLSREVLMFGIFAVLATVLVAAEACAPGWLARQPRLHAALLATVVASGLCGVGSSVMVYHVVRRPFWHASRSCFKFAGTTLVLGLATALASLAISQIGALGGVKERPGYLLPALAGALVLVTLAKLSFEARDQWEGDEDTLESLRRTAWLLRGPLNGVGSLRRAFGVAGGVVLPMLAIAVTLTGGTELAAVSASFSLAASLFGESIERSLFFRAVTRPRMPGGLPS